MAFKLNEKTLEPENGDYIAFLKEIEKGNTRVQGLTVTVSEETPGMVTVRRKSEVGQEQPFASSDAKFVKGPFAFATLLMAAGFIFTLIGVLFIALGMMDPGYQNLIPVGMFVTFGGLVCALSNRQKLERLKRLQQQNSTNNQHE